MAHAPEDGAIPLGIEIPAVVLVLVAGAGYRYFLAYAEPFSEAEIRWLLDAESVQRGVRMAFVMLNGVSLLMLYLAVRRSWGVAAALVAEFAVQTFTPFQLVAMRISPWPAVVAIAAVVATYWRFTRPAGGGLVTYERPLRAAWGVLVLWGFAVWGMLPGRLASATAPGDGDLHRCAASATAGELATCAPNWPSRRSLDQQEAMLDHHIRLRGKAVLLRTAAELAAQPRDRPVVVDVQTGCAFAVTAPEQVEVVRAVLLSG